MFTELNVTDYKKGVMLPNKAGFSFADLYAAFGESDLINISEDFKVCGAIVDSRVIEPGNLFVALKGEILDAHTKIGDAFGRGASAVMADKSWYSENSSNYPDKSFIVVDDTLVGLGVLAKYHRLRFDFPIVAVGGSNGKTTTKDMAGFVLEKKYNLLKTYKNFNNRIGVPLMLLQLSDEFNAAVLEIGTNEPGEIDILSNMVCPTHGLLTNIGKEHLEKLIDIDGVEQEEAYLFGYLNKKGDPAIINMDDERLARYARILTRKFTFGEAEGSNLKATISIDENVLPELSLEYEGVSKTAKLKTLGFASAYNALAAGAIGLAVGMDFDTVVGALEEFETPEAHGYARMLCQNIGDLTLLNDCYNANPSSMAMALKTLTAFKSAKPKLALLGEMREMGDAAEEEHLALLRLAADQADFVFVLGESFRKAADNLKLENVEFYESHEDVAKAVKEHGASCVLLKGSRGMKMETVLEFL